MPELPNKVTVSIEELVFSNMVTLNVLVELLAEKGIVTQEEVLERIGRLRDQLKLSVT
jgi:hypothetical protein